MSTQTMSAAPQTKDGRSFSIRWMIRRDMPDVLAIESAVFQWDAWSENDFIRCLRQRNCIGMVPDAGDKNKDLVIGYMLYELHKTKLTLLNFAVHPDWQRQGVGRAMMDKMKVKLSAARRSRIEIHVVESNLDAHKFLRSVGFRAVNVLRDFYHNSDEDCYLFSYRLKQHDSRSRS